MWRSEKAKLLFFRATHFRSSPQCDARGGNETTMRLFENPDSGGSGSGKDLPLVVLTVATLSAILATALSLYTVTLQLKNYRKIGLQRFTVRILVMCVILRPFPISTYLPPCALSTAPTPSHTSDEHTDGSCTTG